MFVFLTINTVGVFSSVNHRFSLVYQILHGVRHVEISNCFAFLPSRNLFIFRFFSDLFIFQGGSREHIFNFTISESTARSRKPRSESFFCDFERPVAPPLPPNSSHFVFVFEKNTPSRALWLHFKNLWKSHFAWTITF